MSAEDTTSRAQFTARKGDLCAVREIVREHRLGSGKPTEYGKVTLGIVHSASKDGVIKTWRPDGTGPIQKAPERGTAQILNVQARRLGGPEGVQAALKAWRDERPWPSGALYPPMPFGTLAEARVFLGRWLIICTDGGLILVTRDRLDYLEGAK